MRLMLTIYRRHLDDCVHRSKGRAYSKCSCPVWLDGMLCGSRLNYSLKTRNWTKAYQALREVELGEAEPAAKLKTVDAACTEFLRKLETERMSPATMQKYRAALLGTFNDHRDRQKHRYTIPLATFTKEAGAKYVQSITLQTLESYRERWTGGPTTALKRLDRIRAWCGWCVAHGWMKENLAKLLRPPAERSEPTMPYTRAEFTALLSGCLQPKKFENNEVRDNRARLRTLMLVLRYSGLRISDAVQLTADKVRGGRVLLYMQKTSVPVYVPLPPFLMDELEATPTRTGGYWWWNGSTSIDCTAEIWRRRLKSAAAIAGVLQPEWHRFRDTFAVELLLQGVPLEQVSVLLGHRSIRITERHYAPWVQARQTQLELHVQAALLKDPTAQVFELRRVRDSEKEEVRN